MTDAKLPSLQTYADDMLAPEFRQPLKKLFDACAVHGWTAGNEVPDRPVCCGSEVDIRSFIGSAYFAECKGCGRFILDVTGPQFGNGGGYVSTPDSRKVDLNTEETWIAGRVPSFGVEVAGEAGL